jgi:hypothetical protein
MMINVRVVFNGDTLLVALIMLSVAMVSKYIPAWIAQKAAGLARPARGVMFGLTTAHTAVALAVVTLGHSMGMFDDRILNSTVLVILITCAAAPIITGIHASRLKLVMLQREDAEEGTNARVSRRNRVNNTLIPLANARTAQQLVELAVLMRSDVGRHDMFALHVRSDNSPAARAESENALKTAQHTAAAANINITPLDRYDLNIATGILNAINERDITEVIMGLHRRQTIIDSFFGAKVEQLLKSTNKMLIITRCFAPVNTTTRIVVYVPPKAQYETGFSRWVRGISRLTRQLGCRVLWCCPKDIQPFIRGVVAYENYGIRSEFRDAEQWDDFILLANRVLDDDLLFVICARPSSVSFDNSMVEMPSFLQRYFNHTNLIVIYPEQFGENHTPLMSFADPLASDVASAPSPLLLKLRKALRIHSPKKNKD